MEIASLVTKMLSAICLAGVVMLSGCATTSGTADSKTAALPEKPMVSSYYGKGFHGCRTASGERFDMHSDTCAHKTLPFGTVLRVRNPQNNAIVVVTVNNRGPFTKGRHLDLSYGAAKKLGFLKKGVTTVMVSELGRDPRYAAYLRSGKVTGTAPSFALHRAEPAKPSL